MKKILFIMILFFVGCSNTKIFEDYFIEQSQNGRLSNTEYEKDTLFIVGDDSFLVSLKRKSLPHKEILKISYLESEQRDSLYYRDNSITLNFSKNNNQVLFKEFTKDEFASICGEYYLSDKILDDIEFIKYDSMTKKLEFFVTIFTPDTDLDCLVSLIVYENGKYELLLDN